MKKLLLFLFTITCFCCSSSDDDNPCDNLASNGEEVSLNLISTALAYLADNSNSNCVAYETAAEEYIDYSNSILDCLDADDRAELEQEIEDLEAEIAALNCT
ncbi:hypothetical protein BTO05_00915 [Winogradskyella sp. PC-19]|uniref:hypothetical protein n=1 Tax=unclassified Winogradskyella TaxID=2615021 RepID=UPI000B3C1BA6|nr:MULTISPECIES: hypothetical protein [unclassified Winogradskyella]ARV08267.1 hypothetical protein BTO05_00915 [Winogradskyella sp. PC-19]